MSENSFSQVLVNFIPRLLNIADKKISPGLKKKFDADDVVASVCRSVLRRHREGRFSFDDNEELWRLVVVALKRKIFNKVRSEKAAKRDYTKAASIDENELLTALSREPSPDDATELEDILGRVEIRIDEQCRSVLEFKLAGLNNREIAAELNITERTVGRKLVIIRNILTEIIEA